MSKIPCAIKKVLFKYHGTTINTHNIAQTRCPYMIPEKGKKLVVNGVVYTVTSVDYDHEHKWATVNIVKPGDDI